MKIPASLRPALDEISNAVLTARLRPPASVEMFPGGHAGLALTDALLEPRFPRRGHAAKSAERLGRAVAALGKSTVLPILYGGFTGLAWVAEQLKNEGDDDSNEAIDGALLDFLGAGPWLPTYDLIGGLVGYGVYALDRLPRPSAVRLIEEIVAHFSALAVPQTRGLAWPSNPEWWPADLRSEVSQGFNLGMAHGIPGIIALLGRIWRTKIARPEVERLLRGGVDWLLGQELPASSVSRYSIAVGNDGVALGTSRVAWCYGDPGVAIALFVAGRATGERAWERAGLRIAAAAATRDPATAGVFDAGICHGSAGLAHLFNRLHFEAPDERFERAAEYWLRQTLEMRQPGRGFGGYLIPPPPGDKTGAKPKRDYSFLTGTPGIGLALAAFVTPKDGKSQASPALQEWARWDRVLLLSDEPRRPARSPARSGAAPRAASPKPRAK